MHAWCMWISVALCEAQMKHHGFSAEKRSRQRAAGHGRGDALATAPGWHRWDDIMPALRLAREALGLNRGRLDILEKVMACLPADHLVVLSEGELIVHVSNARLAEMTNHASVKSITRLVTELEGTGLLRRKSSANGKRYARQGPDGRCIAFGLDLAPLLQRIPEILQLAAVAAHHNEECRRVRERCGLLATQVTDKPGTTELLVKARKILRRKPDLDELRALEATLAEAASEPPTSRETRCNDTQNACHKDSEQNPYEEANEPIHQQTRQESLQQPTRLTLEVVEQRLPTVAALGRAMNGRLRDLIDRVLLTLGISSRLWRQALDRIGFEESALLAMALYERQDEIRNPPGYMKSLLEREPEGGLPGSRFMASLIALPHGRLPSNGGRTAALHVG